MIRLLGFDHSILIVKSFATLSIHVYYRCCRVRLSYSNYEYASVVVGVFHNLVESEKAVESIYRLAQVLHFKLMSVSADCSGTASSGQLMGLYFNTLNFYCQYSDILIFAALLTSINTFSSLLGRENSYWAYKAVVFCTESDRLTYKEF